MIDIKRIRLNPQELYDALAKRNVKQSIDALLEQDDLRRKLLAQAEQKKALRNAASKQLGAAKKQGVSEKEIASLMNEVRFVGEAIEALDRQTNDVDAAIEMFLLSMPNYLHQSVPVGSDETANEVVRYWGTPRNFLWEPKAYCEIGSDLNILDCESNIKSFRPCISVYRGYGARLQRAVLSFLLDTFCEIGYDEIHLSDLSHQNSCSSADVSVSNLYRDQILNSATLPIHHCAYSLFSGTDPIGTGCSPYGFCGKFPFFNLELFNISTPEQSYEALETMTECSEKMLQLLGLPYRVVSLCTGVLDFSSAKTYEMQVWLPSNHCYVQLSSCSNCEDFQARRMALRYREQAGEKPQFVHTLHGAMDVDCIIAAILENNQNEDGSVGVPEALIPYMGTKLIK